MKGRHKYGSALGLVACVQAGDNSCLLTLFGLLHHVPLVVLYPQESAAWRISGEEFFAREL